jgi:PAS domain S-box
MISILYVDDESGLLHLCKRYLEQTGGFTVDIAESAQAALEKIQTTSYDAIVSDYMMPGMDGIELLKVLRSSGDNTPFLIFTGKGREEVVIEAFNNGADFYLQKGGEPKAQFAELIHMIETAVTHHHERYALEESEKKYRDFFRTSRDAVFITSLTGEIVDVNTPFIKMFGYDSREELMSVNVAELYENPDDRRTHIRTIIEKGYTKEYQVNLRKKDGTLLSTLVTSVPRKDADGNVLGFQGTIRDITEKKRAEEALQESEDKFRSLFENIAAGICIYEFIFDGGRVVDCRILEVNSA